MSNIFNSLFLNKPSSNVFDLSYDVKLSLNMGDLVPVHVQEIVPGDKVTMSTEAMLRFAPLIAPVMHKVDVYQHYFFVPNRILWTGWKDFITDKQPAPAFPYFGGATYTRGSLGDYLGLPVGVAIDKVSAMPFAAYQAIYNEFYRDQNLVTEIDYKLPDGAVSGAISPRFQQIRKRAWQHDYFTASLPFAQKGTPVTMPMVQQFQDVPVYFNNSQPENVTLSTPVGTDPGTSSAVPSSPMSANVLFADTSTLPQNASTVNDLRRAFKLQEWLEKNARGGTRYAEMILSHFGVTSSDARLQRPEYLGGSKQPMVISEVLQTSHDTGTGGTPTGNMAGHGISVSGGNQFSYRAEEHGYIIGIISVTPKTAYQQGIPKHFSKFDKLDYYWPTFAHLGEQEVKNRELYYKAGATDNDDVFGYVPRYAEYKYNDSRVAGDFRTSLSYWHLGRIFTDRPYLNQSFVECVPSTRIFAVEDTVNQHHIYAHVYHKIKAVRKMPKYANPAFL